MSFLSSAPIATLLPFLIAAVAILPVAAIGPQSNEGTDKKEDKQTPVLACSLTSPSSASAWSGSDAIWYPT